MLIHWGSTPTAHLRNVRELFTQLSEPPQTRPSSFFSQTEREDAVVLSTPLPGARSEHVQVCAIGRRLTIQARRPLDPPAGYRTLRSERPVQAFTRNLTIPDRFDIEAVSAELTNGVLTITLPKAAKHAPRSIPVHAA